MLFAALRWADPLAPREAAVGADPDGLGLTLLCGFVMALVVHWACRRWLAPPLRARVWRGALRRMRHDIGGRLFSRHTAVHSWVAGTPGVVGLAPGRLILMDRTTGYRPQHIDSDTLRDLRLFTRADPRQVLLLYRKGLADRTCQTILTFADHREAVAWSEGLVTLFTGAAIEGLA